MESCAASYWSTCRVGGVLIHLPDWVGEGWWNDAGAMI